VKRGNIVDQSAGRFPEARHIAAQAVRGSEAHLGKIRSALLRSIQPALTTVELSHIEDIGYSYVAPTTPVIEQSEPA